MNLTTNNLPKNEVLDMIMDNYLTGRNIKLLSGWPRETIGYPHMLLIRGMFIVFFSETMYDPDKEFSITDIIKFVDDHYD